MNSTWRILLWKEWREHRGMLALMIGVCTSFPLALAIYFQDWTALLSCGALMVGFCVPAAAIFVGAGIAAREQSHRTLAFMQALPSSTKRAAVAKLAVACATVMAPGILASIVVGIIWVARPRNSIIDPFYDDLLSLGIAALISSAAAVSLLIWTAAVGVNHIDELRAGAIGLLVIAFVWGAIGLGIGVADEKYRSRMPPLLKQGIEVVIAGAPAGVFEGTELMDDATWRANPWQRSWPLALTCLTSHGILATWYVVRFGRRAGPRSPTESQLPAKAASQWLSPPRRSRTTAIVWKQFRESAPLAALGGLAILIISPVVARATSTMASVNFVETWQLTAVSVWLMAGVFVSVVAGIGLFYDDLRPALHTFWRSRPIEVDTWFWIKMATGLVVTVSILAAGPLLALATQSLTRQTAFSGRPGEPGLAQVMGGGLLLHSATFVLAALAIVLVRQPVMAAMLTFGAWVATAITIGIWLDDAPQLPFTPLVILGCAALAGCTILAWQALRRNWGWKG